MSKKVRFISEGAIIAALYVVLSLLSAAFGLSSGLIQIRVSEALCILPLLTPSAVPGLFLGCFLANALTGCIIYDIVFGSIATLIGALGTYLVGRKVTSHKLIKGVIPPIVSNMIIIPPVLVYCYEMSGAWWFILLTVGIGEIICAGVLGSFLYSSLKKTHIWK